MNSEPPDPSAVPIGWHFFSLSLWQRWAITLWIVLAVGITIRVCVEPVRSHTVYPIYQIAATHWIEGTSLYGYFGDVDVYRYHPAFAATFRPWLILPERLGGLLWRGLNLFVFLIGLHALARNVLPATLSAGQLGVFFLLPLPLALQSLNNAQANLLVIGLMMLGTSAVIERRWTRAALLIALATILKIYPVSLGLIFSVMLGGRFFFRYLGWVTLGFAVPFLLQSPDYVQEQYAEWLRVSRLDDRLGASLDRCTRDVYMVCRVWWSEPPRWLYRGLQLGAAGLLALSCWRWHREQEPNRESVRWAFHLTCLWMVLLGPATESCTYTLLGPTFAAITVTMPRVRSGRWAWLGLIIAGVLLLIPILSGAVPAHLRPGEWAFQPLAGMILLTVLIMGNKLIRHPFA